MFIYIERDETIHQIECHSEHDRENALQAGGVDVTEAFATEVDLPDFRTRQGVAVARAIVDAWRAQGMEVVDVPVERLAPKAAPEVPFDSTPEPEVVAPPAKRGPFGRPIRGAGAVTNG